MPVIDTNNLKPISTLPRKYKEYVKAVKNTGPIVFMTRSEPTVVLVDFDEWKGYENNQQVKKDQYLKDLMKVSDWTEKDLEDYKKVRSDFDNRTYE